MTTKTAAQPKELARFIADGTGLVVRIRHVKEYRDQSGAKQMEDGGQVAKFEPDYMGGQFFQTDDPEVIAIMRQKANDVDAKFTEVPIPKPPSDEALRQIVKLSLARDVDGLTALYAEEQETHQRPDVLETIEETVAALT